MDQHQHILLWDANRRAQGMHIPFRPYTIRYFNQAENGTVYPVYPEDDQANGFMVQQLAGAFNDAAHAPFGVAPQHQPPLLLLPEATQAVLDDYASEWQDVDDVRVPDGQLQVFVSLSVGGAPAELRYAGFGEPQGVHQGFVVGRGSKTSIRRPDGTRKEQKAKGDYHCAFCPWWHHCENNAMYNHLKKKHPREVEAAVKAFGGRRYFPVVEAAAAAQACQGQGHEHHDDTTHGPAPLPSAHNDHQPAPVEASAGEPGDAMVVVCGAAAAAAQAQGPQPLTTMNYYSESEQSGGEEGSTTSDDGGSDDEEEDLLRLPWSSGKITDDEFNQWMQSPEAGWSGLHHHQSVTTAAAAMVGPSAISTTMDQCHHHATATQQQMASSTAIDVEGIDPYVLALLLEMDPTTCDGEAQVMVPADNHNDGQYFYPVSNNGYNYYPTQQYDSMEVDVMEMCDSGR